MLTQLRHRALYAAFDLFPAVKGAAVHIQHTAGTLFTAWGSGLLYVLGNAHLPQYQREGNIEIVRYVSHRRNVLQRALAYGRLLHDLLMSQAETLRLCHFRDPWSGVPLLMQYPRTYTTVYEVNGLPSLELPALYPDMPPSTRAKLREAEAFCWTRADCILTPSETLRQNLKALGAPAHKICVIPNGADLPGPMARPRAAPECYLIYCGALQPWQGVDVLLRAFARLADLTDVFLVLCVAATPRRTKVYQKLADRLGIAERVQWHVQLPHQELAAWLAHARLAVAPLTECPRNLEQGCCPLKILEAMAAGIPVVASDIPAVRELITDGQHGRLVRPDRPAELARAIRILLEYPTHAQALGMAARQRLAQHFTWTQHTQRLHQLYYSLCPEILPLKAHIPAALGGTL